MIQIEDKNGENITVTNLVQAIEQADYFRNFAHTDKLFEELTKNGRRIGRTYMKN